MKLDNKVLDKMLLQVKFSNSFLISIGFKFWISKEYTEYSNNYKGFDIVKTQILNEETILLCDEIQFLKYNMN